MCNQKQHALKRNSVRKVVKRTTKGYFRPEIPILKILLSATAGIIVSTLYVLSQTWGHRRTELLAIGWLRAWGSYPRTFSLSPEFSKSLSDRIAFYHRLFSFRKANEAFLTPK